MKTHFFKSLCVCYTLSLASLVANPKGMEVIEGSATLSEKANRLTINATDKSLLHWKDFSIGSKEITEFVLPHNSSISVSRVIGGNVSQIFGKLKSNGEIVLINPQGICVGKDGLIDTAKFTAVAMDVLEGDFLKKGQVRLRDSEGTFTHMGIVRAREGDVTILARHIVSEGVIDAPKGVVREGTGFEILLKPEGTERLFIVPRKGAEEKKEGSIGIDEKGVISALSAEIKADGSAYGLAMNVEGVIDALGRQERDGRVFLVADGGRIDFSGKIVAERAEEGGNAHLLAEHILVKKDSVIDVSGKNRGGETLIGGDFQGKNIAIKNAKGVWIEEGAKIDASAKDNGDGGKVIFWGDEGLVFLGNARAEGGVNGGDGGLIETSSPNYLRSAGTKSTLAPKGVTGMLYLDPPDVVISGALDSGVASSGGNFTFSSGSCVIHNRSGALPTGLSFDLLSNSVVIDTSNVAGGPFNGPNNGLITVSNPIVWNANTTLTLKTTGSILVNANIKPSNSGSSIVLDAGDTVTIDNASLGGTGVGKIDITAKNGLTIKSTTSNSQNLANDITINTAAMDIIGNNSVSLVAGNTSSHGITINCSDLTTSANSTISGSSNGFLKIVASGNIVANGTIQGYLDSFFVQAGKSLSLKGSAQFIANGSGGSNKMVIVTNASGAAPFGSSSSGFNMEAGTRLDISNIIGSPAPAISIFSASREANTIAFPAGYINASSNNVPFSFSAAEFVDSTTEKWGVTYSASGPFATAPFTFFYQQTNRSASSGLSAADLSAFDQAQVALTSGLYNNNGPQDTEGSTGAVNPSSVTGDTSTPPDPSLSTCSV